MRRLFILAVFASGVVFGWWTSLQIEAQPKTFEMCVNGLTAVRAEPDDKAYIIYLLPEYGRVWWSGPRTERWLFVDYEHGAGWIESSVVEECLPEIEPNDWLGG